MNRSLIPFIFALSVFIMGCANAGNEAKAREALETIALYGPVTSEEEGELVGLFLPKPDTLRLEWLPQSECPDPAASGGGCYQYLTIIKNQVPDTRLCRCKNGEFWPCYEKKCRKK